MTLQITKLARCLTLFVCVGLVTSAHAHEFWITPVPNPLQVGDTARLTLQVGEFFTGDTLTFAAPQIAALRHYSAAGVRDLAPLLALRPTLGVFALPLPAAGTHMVVFDSQPSIITLPAGTFHAYLHDEGLDFIKSQREAAGTATKPGRERYRRHVKTLIRVDAAVPPGGAVPAEAAANDLTYAVRTGQRLELLPMSNPLTMLPGDALGVQILFEGRPLAGALVKAWSKGGSAPESQREGQTLIVRARTSSDGQVTLNLPYAGPWMVSVVHMVPAVGVKGIDWDSLWGNLSFSVPQPVVGTAR